LRDVTRLRIEAERLQEEARLLRETALVEREAMRLMEAELRAKLTLVRRTCLGDRV
jgi:hypothetical protein